MTHSVAIIPARGGSQRIPKKNIRDFCGLPIIAWSIKVAKSSKLFDRIVVSTDDSEIAAVAKNYGAEIPFIRPAYLSDEITGIQPVMQHALMQLSNVSIACLIYATAPFLREKDLNRGHSLLIEDGSDFVTCVSEFPSPIQRAVKRSESGDFTMFDANYYRYRSQDLEPAYHDAGQFCWGTTKAWLSKTPYCNSKTKALKLPRYMVQDIDTEDDWETATWMYRAICHFKNSDQN